MIDGVPTIIATACGAMIHLGTVTSEPGNHGPRVIFTPRKPLSTDRVNTLKNLGFRRTRKVYGRSLYRTEWGSVLNHDSWTWMTPKPTPYI